MAQTPLETKTKVWAQEVQGGGDLQRPLQDYCRIHWSIWTFLKHTNHAAGSSQSADTVNSVGSQSAGSKRQTDTRGHGGWEKILWHQRPLGCFRPAKRRHQSVLMALPASLTSPSVQQSAEFDTWTPLISSRVSHRRESLMKPGFLCKCCHLEVKGGNATLFFITLLHHLKGVFETFDPVSHHEVCGWYNSGGFYC